MITEEYYSEIFNIFGPIKRARGNFLYTKNGIRLTDLYLENGRAILGWGNDNGENGTGAFLKFKNILNRGLTGSFETDFSKQLDKAVSDLLQANCVAHIFFDIEQAKKAALSLSTKVVKFVPWIGLVYDEDDLKSNVQNVVDFECVLINPPLPWTSNLFILAIRNDIVPLFDSEKISGSLQGAIARSIYDLISELKIRSEKKWFLYDSVLKNYFTRKGPYLFPKVNESEYDDFVLHCMNCNLLISPDYNIPSIVPYGADKGVFSLLKNNLWSGIK